MIIPTLTAYMRCDHAGPEGGCDKAMPVQLVLTVAGGFAFRPPPDAKEWQVGTNQAGIFITLCPKHAQKVVQPPVALASALAGAKH